MDRMKIFKISYRIVSVLLFITVSFCSIFSSCEGVLAADPEINSLPVDIDIDVEYTSDIISLKYLNNTYTINRNTSIDLVGTGYFDDVDFWGSSAAECYSYPVKFEYTNEGYTNASYWFSPSDMKVYVLTSPFCSYPTYKKSIFPVCSYSGSSFSFFKGGSSRKYVILSVIDLSDYSITLGGIYIGVDESYNKYDLYPVGSDVVFGNYFPDDLVCIFSNYSISGFYEPDTSKVNTPDYYFNYQYIFYSEGNGYTFVDSASRLTSIGFPSGVNTARYTFEDTCNFYVYTSVDGITWVKKTSVTTMYSDYFDVEYASNFATTYILVYTNDDTFGNPVVEWDSLHDVLKNIEDNAFHYDLIGNTSQHEEGANGTILDYDPSDSDPSYSFKQKMLSFIDRLGMGFSDTASFGITSYIWDLILDESFSGEDDSFISTLSVSDITSLKLFEWLQNEFSSNVTYDWIYDESSGNYVLHTHTTFKGFLSDIDFKLDTFQDYLYNQSLFLSGLNSNLGYLFDNSNSQLSYLKTISSFSIPDYSDTLHNLEYNLTHVNDDISVEISQLISGLPDYTDSLSGIYTVIEGIPSQLNTLFVADKLVDAIDLDSLFDSDSFDLSAVKSFVSSGISVTAVNSFSKLLDFDAHTLSGFKFINGYITKLYNVNHTFSMVCLIGAGFTTMNYVIRKSKG